MYLVSFMIISSFTLGLEIQLYTYNKLTCRGVVGTRSAGTGGQTVGLVRSGIYTAKLGDGKEVLGRTKDAGTADVLATGVPRIAQGHHVEFQIVATLQEVITNYRVSAVVDRHILILRLFQHVTGKVTCTIIEVVDIEDIVTECATEEEGEVEILVAEVVGH